MLSVAAMAAKATMRMVKFGLRLRTWSVEVVEGCCEL